MPNLDVTNPEDFSWTGQNPYAVDYFDQAIDKKMKKKLDEERDRKYLGHGAYGIAYDIGNYNSYNYTGVVEKITRDYSEIKNAEYLIKIQDNLREDFPVAFVYDYEQLHKKGQSPIYRIFLEKLQPIDASMAVLIDAVDGASFDFDSFSGNEDMIINAAYNIILDSTRDELISKRDKEYTDALSSSRLIDEESIYQNLRDAMNLYVDLESRIKEYGLGNDDIHGRNLGWRGDHLCILDIGAVEII